MCKNKKNKIEKIKKNKNFKKKFEKVLRFPPLPLYTPPPGLRRVQAAWNEFLIFASIFYKFFLYLL